MQKKNYPHPLGFTLIELLLTIVMIIILLALAYPTYRDSILKARRAEARSALHAVMLQQELFYTQHNTYNAFTFHTTDSPFKRWSGDSAKRSYYEISATACPGKRLNQCVLLTATPGTINVKNSDDPVCGHLMLDSINHKSYSNGTAPNSDCW